MKNLYPFFNPIQWIKARRYAKQSSAYDKSSYDLELFLYSKMLTNNMLHYGYFEDIGTRPETISFKQFEDAQMKYAEIIIEHIQDKDNLVLDVGCGMGGLSNMLDSRHFKVECLTPNSNQIEFIKDHYPQLVSHHTNYEQFNATKSYKTIINSESLQYISLIEAFKKTDELIEPGGRWIIIDYFSSEKKGKNQKPHHLETLYQRTRDFDFDIVYERDITLNILPTLSFVDLYVNRILLPVKQFAYEKLRYKKPKLYYLSTRLRESVDRKVEKEIRTVNPSTFLNERKYMLIVLEKTSLNKE